MPDDPQVPDENAPLDDFLGYEAYRKLDPDTFLKALKGLWTLDVGESIIPGSENTTVVKDILVQIDDVGNFAVAAPAIEARIENGFMPDLAVGIKMGLEGKLEVVTEADEQGRFAITVGNVNVIDDQYVMVGGGMDADISFIVRPIIHAMISKMPAAGFLRLDDDSGCTTMRFEGGENFLQIMKRPAPVARMARIEFLDSVPMHRTVPVFVQDQNDIELITHEKVGDKIKTPLCDAKGCDPIVYKRGDTIKVAVVVQVEPKGTAYRLFGVSRLFPHLNFQSVDLISSGREETITLTAKAPVPTDRLAYVAPLITWNVQRAEPGGAWARVSQPNNPSRTGPHRLFTIYDTPRPKNSYGMPGEDIVLTERRVLTAIEYCKKVLLSDKIGTQHPDDIHALARAIQQHVNGTNYPLLSMDKPSTFKRGQDTANRLFGLMDRMPIYADMMRDAAEQIQKEDAEAAKKNPNIEPETDLAKVTAELNRRVEQYARTLETGNCWEASMLMEQLLRMIGVDATQVHIYARSTLPPLKKGDNVSDQVGGPEVGKIEFRMCHKHMVDGKVVPRGEYLYLNFNPRGDLRMRGAPTDKPGYPNLNQGEGCVRVGQRLYGGLTDFVVGPADGRTAAHNMLLVLEEEQMKNENAWPWRSHFQIWAAPAPPDDDSSAPPVDPRQPKPTGDGSTVGKAETEPPLTFKPRSFCTELEPGQKIPGVPVPK